MVPINSTHQDEPICTLECIVLAIGLARNKTFKDVLANTSAKLYWNGLPNLLYITMWIRWLWLGHIGEYGPRPSKLGCNTTLRPSAVGWYCTPISQDIGPYSPIRPRQSQRILSFFMFRTSGYHKNRGLSKNFFEKLAFRKKKCCQKWDENFSKSYFRKFFQNKFYFLCQIWM